jgi:hypothetical protein
MQSVAYENLERFFQEEMILTESVRQDLIDIESKELLDYFNLDATKKHYWFLAEVLEQEE